MTPTDPTRERTTGMTLPDLLATAERPQDALVVVQDRDHAASLWDRFGADFRRHGPHLGRLPNGSTLRTYYEAQGFPSIMGLSLDVVLVLVPVGANVRAELGYRLLRKNGRMEGYSA